MKWSPVLGTGHKELYPPGSVVMTRLAISVVFVTLATVARFIFALTWVQSVFVAMTLAVLFWLLLRSNERLRRVEACLGTDRE
jgi:hypothetical protein